MSDDQDLTLADGEEVTEPLDEGEESQEQEQTQEQEQETEEQQPTEDAEQPKWSTRHRSPEEVFEENRRLQSELDKKKRELEMSGVEVKPPAAKSSEDMLREFAANPQGFVEQFIAPLKARQAMNDFLADPDNSKRFGPYRNELVQRLGGNLNVLGDPQILKAAFLLMEDEYKSAKLDVAANAMAEHRESVKNTKKGKAFVEGSATSQKKSAPVTIKPGMTQAEMDKVLDQMGVQEEQD